MSTEKKNDAAGIIKLAGAFVTFIVGSGFASGQEIIQFFSSYGYWGLAAGVISMILFAWSSVALMTRGYEAKQNGENFEKHPFTYWFMFKEEGPLVGLGKALGTFFEYFIPVFLFSVVVIMVSGAGATMQQFFGLNTTIGCLIMAGLVFVTVIFGLRRIVDMMGIIGPITTAFTIFLAVFALLKDISGLAVATETLKTANLSSAAGNWQMAGILYVAYNVTGSVPFFTTLGAQAASKKRARISAVLGSIMLMIPAIVLVLAHLAYAKEISGLQVPNLFLANLVSPACGLVFTVFLLAEIYSCAVPMLWTTCNKFTTEGTTPNKILAFVLAVVAFFGGRLPFDVLVGTIYPYMGYIGIFFFVCILIKQIITAAGKKSAA